MATHTIRVFGDPVLKRPTALVTDIDGALVKLVDAMYDTMYEAPGVGLAAPQVGVQKRFFVYDVQDDTGEVELPREGGVLLEARLEDGDLRLPQGLTPTVQDRVSTVKAPIAGGGPLVKISLSRGMLRIRGRAVAPES